MHSLRIFNTKKLIVGGLLFLVASTAFAQNETIIVNGKVKDQQGNNIAYVFLRDQNHNYATYSDSLGNYSIKTTPNSTIFATSLDYGDVFTKITNASNVDIIMRPGTPHANNTDLASDIFKDKSEVYSSTAGSLAYFGSNQGELHGSRYLFSVGLHGFAINKQDSIKQGNVYLFNYDKVNGELILTRDNKNILQIDRDLLKQFTLMDGSGRKYIFDNVPAIDKNRFLEVISSGNKYKIYKAISCKLVKANFTTNGITSSGNNYDEYVDEYTYYLVKLPDGSPQKLVLKRKALKAAFPDDSQKVQKYFSDHADGNIDDGFLADFGDYLNQ